LRLLVALGSLILTIAGGDLSLPRLAPDGRRIAYARGGEVRVAVVATRHTDVVIPARYGAIRDLEWSDDQHVAGTFARTLVTADVVHKTRKTGKAPATKPRQSIDFCGTTLRAEASRDALTLFRVTGTETMPLATIYPADKPSIAVRRTTPSEVIFLAGTHLMSYDGVRLHAYGIDGLDDVSFSADGHRIVISVWRNGQRQLLVYER
jgi:hypothetical protein